MCYYKHGFRLSYSTVPRIELSHIALASREEEKALNNNNNITIKILKALNNNNITVKIFTSS